jgi:N-acetylglucosamine-6-sulfatase
MRHQFLAAICLVTAGGYGVAAENPQPNIVFVIVDDIRWDAFGCMGHPWVKTPNVDRLAREGALFKNFFDTIPLCSPARASFLTGRYPHANGVKDNTNNNAISHKLVTWPGLLHVAGYETAFVGKWHMGNDDAPRPGFDRWVSFKGQGVYLDPVLNIDGKSQRVNGYITDLLDGYAVDFVRKKHDKPFVLYLAHKAVHGPFTPAARHQAFYTDDPFTLAVSSNDDRAGKPAVTSTLKPAAANRPARQPGEGVMRNQLRCLTAVDEGLGDILKALADIGQLDNTVVAFTSDNGYFWGEHGGLGDKRWAYEESVRLPLMMRYPKLIKPGTLVNALTLNIDVAPTMLEVAGAPIPTDIQGRSMVPLLRGESSGARSAILMEYFKEQQYPHPTWRAVRTNGWKYIHYPNHDDWDELYDLQVDPHELKNRVNDPTAQKSLMELREELDRQWKATGGR